MRLELEGTVDFYAWDADQHICDVSPTIGGENLVTRLQDAFGAGYTERTEVRVLLGVEPVREGPLWACHGFGGTDVTPYESPEVRVGDWDLLEDLRALDGREVLLVVEELPR